MKTTSAPFFTEDDIDAVDIEIETLLLARRRNEQQQQPKTADLERSKPSDASSDVVQHPHNAQVAHPLPQQDGQPTRTANTETRPPKAFRFDESQVQWSEPEPQPAATLPPVTRRSSEKPQKKQLVSIRLLVITSTMIAISMIMAALALGRPVEAFATAGVAYVGFSLFRRSVDYVILPTAACAIASIAFGHTTIALGAVLAGLILSAAIKDTRLTFH